MTSLSSEQKKIHLANRISFGVNQQILQQINQLGIEQYLESQLNPQQVCLVGAENFQHLNLTVTKIFQRYDTAFLKRKRGREVSPQRKLKIGRIRRKFLTDTLAFKYINSVNNPCQLQDVMTDFWFNHFNVFAHKIPTKQRFLMYDYEQKTIRSRALGKFKNLVMATARHPSMLLYLDNWRNVAPKTSRGLKSGLNENYARELMELHTLGVNGGYTQEDVISLAKILTGWSVIAPRTKSNPSGFFFFARQHDYSDKIFLGQTIKGEGINEVNRVIDILAKHPSTAKHISFKLAQYFVADQPPTSLVNSMSKTFLSTDGNIAAVLRHLFQSEEFWSPQYYANKFKTPYQYVISLLRMANVSQPKAKTITTTLLDLGMLPYNHLTPDGYKYTKSAWLSPSATINRVKFAKKVAVGAVNNQSQKVNPNQLMNLMSNHLSASTLQVINDSPDIFQSALILGSPELMYR